ncbi:hypothetical protein DPX39_100097800 [Trypanosoma brucei equiperdum]|uniref:Uncharacterized protein n=1 Tax=Trypanosoma brucei equiperdum TaxID=630700 RepID=A0A3L6L1K1_9TRYP|nr:hypothetical protein DPX39_100097800 [Trypanosoma brucei equiperdum]
MSSTTLVETLQEEIGALQAEVARLRIMVHRVTRGTDAVICPATKGDIPHRILHENGSASEKSMGHADVVSQDLVLLLKRLLQSPGICLGQSSNTAPVCTDATAEPDGSTKKKPKRKRREKGERKQEEAENKSRPREVTERSSGLSPTKKQPVECAIPSDPKKTPVREQAGEKEERAVLPATRNVSTPRRASASEEPRLAPAATTRSKQSNEDNVVQQQTVRKRSVPPPSPGSLVSIPRDGFLSYEHHDEEPTHQPPLVGVTQRVGRRALSSSSSSDDLPVGTGWVPTASVLDEETPQMEEVSRATRSISSVGRLAERSRPSPVRDTNLTDIDDTHLSIKSHRGIVECVRESNDGLDGARGRMQFVSVDFSRSQQVKRRKLLSRLRDSSFDSEETCEEDLMAEHPSPTQRSTTLNAQQTIEPPQIPNEVERAGSTSTRSEVAMSHRSYTHAQSAGYVLDMLSDCEFTEDVAA